MQLSGGEERSAEPRQPAGIRRARSRLCHLQDEVGQGSSRAATVGDDLKLIRELSCLQPDGSEACNSFLAWVTVHVEREAHRLIEELLDARLIHILKRSISGHDEPGVRYRAYKIDYGCYVQLLKTAKAPLGLFKGEDLNGEDKFVDVPPDDYRAIRRSILDMSKFNLEKLKRDLPSLSGTFQAIIRSLTSPTIIVPTEGP